MDRVRVSQWSASPPRRPRAVCSPTFRPDYSESNFCFAFRKRLELAYKLVTTSVGYSFMQWDDVYDPATT